jgi:MFS family permease
MPARFGHADFRHTVSLPVVLQEPFVNQTRLSLRLTVLLSLYLAEGLPGGITTQALPAIMRSHGISLSNISFAGILMAPWALKFLWAPWLDTWFWPRLGQRRSWILPTQLAGVGMLVTLAFFDPAALRAGQGLVAFISLLFVLNLFAATHDIATDGLSVRLLNFSERGLGNGIQVSGYRLGIMIGGGLLLVALDNLGWRATFLSLALILFCLLLPTLLLHEPPPEVEPRGHRLSYLHVFTSFFALPGRVGWLMVLLVYKAGESLGSSMVKPMLIDMHYSLTQIGLMVTTFGSLADVAGALLGGWLTGYIGRYRALLIFGGLQAVTVGGFGWLAWLYAHGSPPPAPLVYGWGMLEHMVAGMATAALLTCIMDLTRPEHAGADFTLQVSALSIFSGLLYLVGGHIAQLLGYPAYYALSAALVVVLLAVPAVVCRQLPGLGR